MQSAVLGSVDRAYVVVVDNVDVFWRQLVVKVVLDAVDVSYVAHAVRHASHARVHYARVHLLLQPCTAISPVASQGSDGSTVQKLTARRAVSGVRQ